MTTTRENAEKPDSNQYRTTRTSRGQLTGTATCTTCEWTDNGDPTTVDKAADKHTRVNAHSTAVAVTP